ncbi:ParA family protein [Corallococcus exiguus]|uniref:ParA family protein n=1 Tax=Corallococcus exiguus TaxID=83462 RepID=UPI001494D185|nr:AAA family ATPase [Corallococcus exiguus]NPD29676.1 AAA family ATPase [Corallococcus exiguus]
MKSIAFFNNKGGVGKTTLACNLSAYLSLRMDKRILIIDADPQCNSTQILFDDEQSEKIYSENRFTISTIIKPLSIGKGYSKNLEPTNSSRFGVDVIPGDPRLALTEDLLAIDWGQAISGSTRGLRTTFLFSELLSRCSHYDYVIFDMGPSLGSINRSILIATDFFLTPVSTDIFSVKAMENISTWLQKWQTQLQSGLEQNEEPEDLELPSTAIKLAFAGYVTQHYTAKRFLGGERQAVKAFDKIIKQLPAAVTSLTQRQGAAPKNINYNLGGIPNLHSLLPLSQISRKPIFELSGKDGVVGAHFTKINEYEGTIKAIANNLLDNLEALS